MIGEGSGSWVSSKSSRKNSLSRRGKSKRKRNRRERRNRSTRKRYNDIKEKSLTLLY